MFRPMIAVVALRPSSWCMPVEPAVRLCRRCGLPVTIGPAHSGQWNPTEAVYMHSPQITRLHRWQLTPARRSGCQAQVSPSVGLLTGRTVPAAGLHPMSVGSWNQSRTMTGIDRGSVTQANIIRIASSPVVVACRTPASWRMVAPGP